MSEDSTAAGMRQLAKAGLVAAEIAAGLSELAAGYVTVMMARADGSTSHGSIVAVNLSDDTPPDVVNALEALRLAINANSRRQQQDNN